MNKIKQKKIIISAAFVFISFFMAGWLGIIIEIIISLITFKLIDINNKRKLISNNSQIIYTVIGLLLGLGIQFVGVIMVGGLVQTSIMGQ